MSQYVPFTEKFFQLSKSFKIINVFVSIVNYYEIQHRIFKIFNSLNSFLKLESLDTKYIIRVCPASYIIYFNQTLFLRL